MRTYRELFAVPGFAAFFLASTCSIAASTIGGLALGTLTFARTGSPFLASMIMFGPSLAQVAGALLLLSVADRLPPRAALAGFAAAGAVGAGVQSLPGAPIGGLFAVAVLLGLAASVLGGVRSGLLTDLVPREAYVLARSTLNLSVGGMQVFGYAAGGVLVTVLSPQGTLRIAAALQAGAAAVTLLGLPPRPARAIGRAGIARTWRTNRMLLSSPARRATYLALWVPNGLIVGCESIFIAYDPEHAGALFAGAAAGMLAGDLAAGRFLPPSWRARTAAPLRLALAAPYLLLTVRPHWIVAVAAVTVASVGYAAGLMLQERLLEITPDDVTGHALGLHSSGMLAFQGIGAAVAGTTAQALSPALAMGTVAAGSLAVTLALRRPLAQPVSHLAHGVTRVAAE